MLVASLGNLWKAPVLSKDPDGAVVVIFDQDVFELSTFGTHRRIRTILDGAIVSEEGQPLGVETVFDEIDDPAVSHLELLCRLAGITRDDLRRLDWYAITPLWKKSLSKLFGR